MSATRILVLAANPTDTAHLRLDKQIDQIRQCRERSKLRDDYSLDYRLAVSVRIWRRALLDYKPHVVHFCGHGIGEAGLALENEATGNAQLLPTEAIAELFDISEQPECVILNACYSEVQATAIHQWVPVVVGMKQDIGDAAALEFAVGFYDGLFAGLDYQKSFRVGRNAIQAQSIPEHLTPVLLLDPQYRLTVARWNLIARRRISLLRRSRSAWITSLTVSFGIISLRLLGAWQTLELQHYDLMLRSNFNAAGLDSRLFIIESTDADFQRHFEDPDTTGASNFFPDNYLETILSKLTQDPENSPRVIGLDVVRTNPAVESGLAQLLAETSDLITVCNLPHQNNSGKPPVPEVENSSSAQQRIAFSEVYPDGDRRIRRFGMVAENSDVCPASEAFALKLAETYLQSGEQAYVPPYANNSNLPLMLGNVSFARLGYASGGYQRAFTASEDLPYEVLVNYRNTPEGGHLEDIADSISVNEFINTAVDPSRFKDKIVLIGGTATGNNTDIKATPLGQMPGVVVHAHFVSYLLDVVEGERTQIHWLPTGIDSLIILGWSIAGGFVSLVFLTPRRVLGVSAIAASIYTIICFSAFWSHGLWLPFVPAMMSFICTGTIVVARKPSQT